MTAKKWVAVSSVRTGVPGIAKRSTYLESVAGRGLTQNSVRLFSLLEASANQPEMG